MRIPRRGRIRAVLILVTVTAALFLICNNRQKSSLSVEKSHNDSIQNKKAAKSRKHSRAKKNSNKEFKFRAGSSLTAADVSSLLTQYPPSLEKPVDTIREGQTALAFHTSIDTSLVRLVRKLLKTYHPKYASAVAIDPKTGRVLLLIDYTNPEEKPISSALYCSSILPSASIFKIITAAAAVEKAGLTAESNVRTCGNNHTLYRFQLVPELRNFREVPLIEAFAYSINPVFARLGIYTIGAASMREYVTKFGFNQQVPFELKTEAGHAFVPDSAFDIAELSSGFNHETSISPLFGALLASAFSNNGKMPLPTLVDSVTEIITGTKVYAASRGIWKTPVAPGTARNVKTMMQAVPRYGTARKSFNYVKRSARFSSVEYGGKTGNIELDGTGRVDWFAGFASDPENLSLQIALAVVTVHGPYWTVHSSFIGAEIMREFIRDGQIQIESAGRKPENTNTENKSQG